MGSDRTARISEEVRRELSQMIFSEIKDPRLSGGMVSVTSVKVTPDLRFAKVFVSVYAAAEAQQEALKGLKSAAGFIRREIGHRLNLRYTPEFHFELDDSIAHGIHIAKLLRDTIKPTEPEVEETDEQE